MHGALAVAAAAAAQWFRGDSDSDLARRARFKSRFKLVREPASLAGWPRQHWQAETIRDRASGDLHIRAIMIPA